MYRLIVLLSSIVLTACASNVPRMQAADSLAAPLNANVQLYNKQEVLDKVVRDNSVYYANDACISYDASFTLVIDPYVDKYIKKYRICYDVDDNTLTNRNESYCRHYADGRLRSSNCHYSGKKSDSFVNEVERLNRVLPSLLEQALVQEEADQAREAEIFAEQEKLDRQREKEAELDAERFRKSLARGDMTHCGLVIAIDRPLVKIQTPTRERWIKVREVKPEFVNDIAPGCPYQ